MIYIISLLASCNSFCLPPDGAVTLKSYRGRKLHRPTLSVVDKFQTCLATDDATVCCLATGDRVE